MNVLLAAIIGLAIVGSVIGSAFFMFKCAWDKWENFPMYFIWALIIMMMTLAGFPIGAHILGIPL